MYGPPPVVAVPVARRAGLASAPTLAISCLLFLLLLIAATIVLALIPIYLPRKGAQSAATQTFYIVLSYNGTVGSDGPLDAQARANLAHAIEKQYGLPTGSVVVTNLVAVTTPSGKRKRREPGLRRIRRGLTKSGGEQKVYGIVKFIKQLLQEIEALTFTDDVDFGNGPLSVIAEVFTAATDAITAALNTASENESATSTTTTIAATVNPG